MATKSTRGRSPGAQKPNRSGRKMIQVPSSTHRILSRAARREDRPMGWFVDRLVRAAEKKRLAGGDFVEPG